MLGLNAREDKTDMIYAVIDTNVFIILGRSSFWGLALSLYIYMTVYGKESMKQVQYLYNKHKGHNNGKH